VKPANRAVATQDLTLRVLPFTLMKPDPYRDITFSILTNHNDCRYASYGMNVFTENIRKHFADMVEHGLTSTGYFCMQPEVELVNGKIVAHFDRPGAYALYSPDTIMALYRESGLTGPFEYQKGPYQMYQYYLRSIVKKDHYTPEYDNAFQEVMRQTVQHMREKNWPELIFVLGDEPGAHADRIKMHRRAGDLLKAVAPNVRTGNYFNGGWAGVTDWKILKPVTDINCTNFVNREVIDDTRELGFDSLWLYNGTSMGRDPKVERMFYGIQPWKVGAKGVTQYMYQCRAANPYDMFAEERVGKSTVGGSAYFYAYPSSGGPIPTPHWEAIRQGIYDYRYLFTLKHAIARARAAGKTQTADEAQKTLDEITNAFPDDFQTRRKDEIVRSISNEMLDIWRWKAARAIMHLN